ncbi:MAG: GNAT family N-acetyltransferase, partial [Actinomycetota bacterium]|nr:GNAT family N-acetyltransferase [Actinomycetota bacterium]
FDAYLKTFSSKSRSTLQRKVRKFADADGGRIDWREFTRPEEMEQFVLLASEVSVKTYQERLLHNGLPGTPEFIAEAKDCAASGGAYGYILFLHKKPVAYVFCFCTNGIATYDYVGYDPTVASLSAGTVLQYLLLESLFNEKRVKVFDFTEGEGQHKLFFGTDEQLCAKTYFFQRRLMTVLLVNLHYRLNTAIEGVGRLLDKLGLKARVRKLIRRAA